MKDKKVIIKMEQNSYSQYQNTDNLIIKVLMDKEQDYLHTT